MQAADAGKVRWILAEGTPFALQIPKQARVDRYS